MKLLANLTYKQKLKLLAISILPVIIICYKLSIANTIAEYQTYKQYSNNHQSGDELNTSYQRLQEKNKRISQILERYKLDTVMASKNLLPVVTEICYDYHLQLKEFKPIGIAETDNMKLLTRTLTVEGDFFSCLNLVHALETQYQVGRVSSVGYKTYTDVKDKNLKLTCTLFVQNLID
jgi:hypothetical protein